REGAPGNGRKAAHQGGEDQPAHRLPSPFFLSGPAGSVRPTVDGRNLANLPAPLKPARVRQKCIGKWSENAVAAAATGRAEAASHSCWARARCATRRRTRRTPIQQRPATIGTATPAAMSVGTGRPAAFRPLAR